jgi:hypothetical protein
MDKTGQTKNEFTARPSRWLYDYGLVFIVYLLATSFTDAHMMADTADYVDSVNEYTKGIPYKFWEFGHLFWRPLGWAAYTIFKPLTSRVVGEDTVTGIVFTLLAINWLAGLLCVLSMRGLLGKVCERWWVASLVTIAFIFSHGFLNYAQAGTSYTPGLAMLLVGLYILVRGGEKAETSLWTPLAAGAALSMAVCMWFLYVWAIPATLLAPLFLFGTGRGQRRLVLQTALACALLTAAAYAVVLINLDIYTLTEMKAWMMDAGHGTRTWGVSRTVFGLPRSFIYMGNDGMLLKRYLLGDPFNSVSLGRLMLLSLWKLVLFYALMLAMAVNLLRSQKGRRMLCLFMAYAAPIITFAIFFDGGAIERYLPLYPVVFMALACSLCFDKSSSLFRYAMLGALIVIAVVNVSAMSKSVLSKTQETIVVRIRDLQPRLNPQSFIYTVTWMDDLINLNRSFPMNPINRRGNLRVRALVTPGGANNSEWREVFAAQALVIWDNGGEVWVSEQVRHTEPRSEWNWVEGDDRQVSWREFPEFFSRLKLGATSGGENGFSLLLPDEENRRILSEFARKKP